MTDILATLPSWAAAGGGVGAGFFFAKYALEWLGGRLDKREAAVAARDERLDVSTQKLIGTLEERMSNLTARLDRVEEELINCRAQHAQCEAELTRLRATVQGLGDAKQHAQSIIAAERLIDRGNAK
jgi:septal ring factor EnvC (AmiA/AmiB activator)